MTKRASSESCQTTASVISSGWPLADKAIFNDVLEAMATFREVHYGWAQQYIERHVADPRGTGGTPYAQWLKQLIDETRAAKIA